MRVTTGLRFLALLSLTLGLLVTGASRALAGGPALSITVHVSECPTGVGSDIFEECHPGFDSGVVVSDDVGTATLVQDPDISDNYLGSYVYCRDLTDDEVLFDGNVTDAGGAVTFDTEDGDDIVCDWYNITPAEEDGGSSSGGVTALPNTGSGRDSGNTPWMLLFGLVGAVGALGLRARRSVR